MKCLKGKEQWQAEEPRNRWRPAGAIVIVIAIILGLLSWDILGKLNEYRPLYELQLENSSSIVVQMKGPYLIAHYQLRNNQTNEEYRSIIDGKLVFELKNQPQANSMNYLPTIGVERQEGLLANRFQNDGTEIINWIQPQHQQQVTRASSMHGLASLKYSESGEYYAVVRLLPVSLFTLLHGNGLGDALAAQLHYYLHTNVQAHPESVAILNIFSTRTGKRISSCSLPAIGTHLFLRLLDDGEHVLLPSLLPVSELESLYRLSKIAPEDMTKPAPRHTCGLKLFNCHTGLIEKEWYDTDIILNPRQVDCDHFLIASIQLNLKQYWSNSWPDADRLRLFNWRSGKEVDLQISKSTSSIYSEKAEEGFQLLQRKERAQIDDEYQIIWQLRKINGEVDRSSSFTLSRNSSAFLIPHSNQIIIHDTVARSSLQELLLQWSQHYSWLKYFAGAPNSSISLWDIASEQRVLIVAKSRNIQFQASKDGKHLMIATSEDETPKRYHVKVYALPLLPTSWWMKWLPTAAGFLIALASWWLLRRYSKLPTNRHPDPTAFGC